MGFRLLIGDGDIDLQDAVVPFLGPLGYSCLSTSPLRRL
jgi:hypothetical protein